MDIYGNVKEENLCKVAKWGQYNDAKPKVLFILKEPSTRGNNQNYDYKESLADEKWDPSKMWKLLAWCSGGFQKDLDECRKLIKEKEGRKNLLKYSSYMNLKRFGDGTSSDMSLVGLHTGLFWPLMMNEIKELRPDIIVFCGTFPIFKELIKCLNKLPDYARQFGYSAFGEIKIDGNSGRVGQWKCNDILGKSVALIQMPHPARKNHEQYFNNLMTLSREILNDKK